MIHRKLFIFALLSAVTVPMFAMENKDDELVESLISRIDGKMIILSDLENNDDDIIIFLCDINDENADPSSVPVKPSSPTPMDQDNDDDPARSEKRKHKDSFAHALQHHKKSRKK